MLIRSADGAFEWRLDGRVQLDAAFYSGSDNELANGSELRRGRLAFKVIVWEDWAGEFDVDFADNEVDVKDAWVAYIGADSTIVKIGNYKEPFSLEEVTSSRNLTFMERSLPNVFAPSRHLGVGYATWRDRWFLAGGLFGEEIGDVDETGEDDGYGASGRFVFRPVSTPDRVVHLGIGATYRTPSAGSNDRVRFRTRSETHVNRARFLNTGQIGAVDSTQAFGLEAAARSGSFSFQAEYIQSQVDRLEGRPTADFDGWYAFVSWFPTGDVRPYVIQDAEFGPVVPKSRRGAVELALRFSTVDLNDLAAGVTGGSGDVATFGVNWYANPNIRLMLNLSQVDHDEFADGDGDFLANDSFTVAQARFQLNF